MLIVKTTLKEIPGKGIGLIADQEIRKGRTVFSYNPAIDIKIYKGSVPEEAKEFFETYALRINRYYYLNMDNARFINHSEYPNTKNLGLHTINIATKHIFIGDEITIDYRELEPEFDIPEDYV